MVEQGEIFHQFEHFGRKSGISFDCKIISTYCKRLSCITYNKNVLWENPFNTFIKIPVSYVYNTLFSKYFDEISYPTASLLIFGKPHVIKFLLTLKPLNR